jgi:hypothetical protein
MKSRIFLFCSFSAPHAQDTLLCSPKKMQKTVTTFEGYGRARLEQAGVVLEVFPPSLTYDACLDAMECGLLDVHAKSLEEGKFFWARNSQFRYAMKHEREYMAQQEYLWQDLAIVQAYVEIDVSSWVIREISQRWQCSIRRAWIVAAVH